MILKNYTSHPLTIVVDGNLVTWKQDGFAQVQEELPILVAEGNADGVIIPVIRRQFGNIIGLPEQQEGVMYVVSNITAQAAESIGRTDCVCPNTIRDNTGRVIGMGSVGYLVGAKHE
jgi:hypothetical protein